MTSRALAWSIVCNEDTGCIGSHSQKSREQEEERESKKTKEERRRGAWAVGDNKVGMTHDFLPRQNPKSTR
jgi:hypothetical protein